MKCAPLYLLLLLVIFISGCQKEPDAVLPEENQPGETPDGNRLARMVYQYSPIDSVYTEFFYDGSGRWMGQRTVGDDEAVLTESSEIRVVRNANGIVTSYTVKEDDGAGTIDSTIYTVHYDNATNRYTSRVFEFEANGETIIDSTIFLINNGRMASQRFLFKEKATGLFLEMGKVEFAYDGAGNPITAATYTNDPLSGRSNKEGEVNFRFDDKKAALYLGVEALVLDQIFFASPNNITQVTFKDLANPNEPDGLLTINYEYHPSDKPKSAVIMIDGEEVPMYFRYN